VDFTIVTPSFRQLEQLGCCIASIADQEGVSVEHIVQDGGTEGFAEFAKKTAKLFPDRAGYRRIMTSEKDEGMYDAINRGLEKAQGSICAYLNCDEQYLPGALKKVAEKCRAHPEADLFFGDALVLDVTGNARCWRKVLVPLVAHTWTCHFAAFTAAMFFRRRILEPGLRFDASYRAAADAAWYLQARARGVRARALGTVTSVFLETGKNLGLSPTAMEERRRLNLTAPPWMAATRWIWPAVHRLRRWLAGSLCPRRFNYAVYLPGRFTRTTLRSNFIPGIWPGRWHRP